MATFCNFFGGFEISIKLFFSEPLLNVLKKIGLTNHFWKLCTEMHPKELNNEKNASYKHVIDLNFPNTNGLFITNSYNILISNKHLCMCIYLYILVALFAVPVNRQRNQSLVQYSGSCLDNGWSLVEVLLEAISSSFFLFH